MPSITTPTTAAAAAATTGAYSDIPTEAPVPLPLFGSSPAVTAAVVLSAAAMLGAVCSAAFFVRRGFKRGFSPATIALAAINVLALTLEVFQTLFSNASHGNRVFYDWRNVWLPLSTLSLNLLQIEVAAVFQGSLIRLSWLTPDKLPIVRAAAIVVHFVCCWSSYLQAWLQNDTHSPVAQLLGNIMAAYELFIPLFGVALNGYIMFGIRRDIAPPLANGDERPMITATRRKLIRVLQALIAVVILLDLMVIGGYVMAMISDSQQVHTLEYYCFLDIAIAFFAMHMSAETIMFERIVMIFRTPSTSFSGVGERTINSPHFDIEVAATLDDMNQTNRKLQHRDSLSRIEAVSLRKMATPSSPTSIISCGTVEQRAGK
ncbi:hypothetical protein HK105_206551 [Polyrhizophydium stewartii]|uniref:Uncharacterized protein n=1 Tax=Polyrhizophydium stewartii TaxID=2732419 RepID=A0ABR4N362_9FUNG